jgi:hypothetical protein
MNRSSGWGAIRSSPQLEALGLMLVKITAPVQEGVKCGRTQAENLVAHVAICRKSPGTLHKCMITNVPPVAVPEWQAGSQLVEMLLASTSRGRRRPMSRLETLIAYFQRLMVGAAGFEPATSTV